MPRVSVIVPAHNSEAWIAEAIRSVEAQSYRDWEVVVADDASSDGTPQVLDTLRSERVTTLRSDVNLGPAGARNLALEHARGELIAFLDADDWWEPEFLAAHIRAFDGGGERVGIVTGDARVVTPAGFEPGTYRDLHPAGSEIGLADVLHRNPIFVSSLVPRAALDEVGWFDPEIRGAEDFDLWLRILEAGWRAIAIPEALAVYRRSPDALTASAARAARADRLAYEKALARGRLGKREQRIARARLRERRAVEAVAAAREPGGTARLLRALPSLPLAAASNRHLWRTWARGARARLRRPRADAVLIVTPWYLPLLGGQERQVALLAEELRRRGHEVDVLTERTPPDAPRHEARDGVSVTRVGTSTARGPLTYLRLGLAMGWFLLRRRRRYRFAMVRTLTFPGLLVGLMKRLRLLRYPSLVTAETGGERDDVISLRDYPAWRAFRWVLGGHDVLNAICADNTRHYRELGFPEEKLALIYNGVDTTPYARIEPPQRVRTFGFLGRLHREKGVHELLEAFAQIHAEHPDTRLVIAGSGEEESTLRERAGDGVEFAGRVPYEELDGFFRSIDCLVLPSYSEGMPLSVLEAAAHRRAIVATDVSDLRELFGDEIFFAEKRDTRDLQRAMEAAMAGGTPSYDHVVGRIAIGTVADQLAGALSSRRPG